MTDLFSAAAEDKRRRRAPLAERMRPEMLDDIAGQKHLLAKGRPLRALIESDRLGSVIFWGPPGTGKTTLARVIARATRRAFVPLSAVTAGVKDVRTVAEEAMRRLGERSVGTILFLDEVHRFNKAQQDVLLPCVEDGTVSLIGATTENPFFELNAPLLSRSTLFRLQLLDPDELIEIANRALAIEGIEADEKAIAELAEASAGDARSMLTSLEVAIALGGARDPETSRVEMEDIESACAHRIPRYGRDEHYDVVSAFIKSIRGSDADAGLYWLSRMLAAGEDARFIARRLIVLASEDISEADPTSLVIAVAGAQAVEHVGLPEASLNLAQVVVHLARAPKSNRSMVALARAQKDVEAFRAAQVPPHLRDSHYKGAKSLGHGSGYEYPHDHPGGWVEQQYLPDELVGHVYYEPDHQA